MAKQNKQMYYVFDESEYTVHTFDSETQLIEWLNSSNFEGNPADEVSVVRGVEVPISVEYKV